MGTGGMGRICVLRCQKGFEMSEPEGFYDESGRYWPHDAEWCDRCQGMGIANCYCGGDQCYCENYGEMECPRCGGEGYFVPTEAFKAARAKHVRWWRELNDSLAASAGTRPQGGDGEAGSMRSTSDAVPSEETADALNPSQPIDPQG